MRAFKAAAGRLEQFPDTPSFFERNFQQTWKQYALLLILGLVLRAATFGDPNLHVDEAFYFLIGQEMNHGALPYVDIWDRKPFGLFLIYYLMAGISTSAMAYQIPAWLFASTTALIISRIAIRWTGIQGAVLAGASYLFMLGPQGGHGGQSPVFYNLMIAGAALLVLEARPQLDKGMPTWRTFWAMALCGMALTIKQTALFEAMFLGLFVSYCLVRSEAPTMRVCVTIIACAALGALPTLAIGTGYYLLGHWTEWWHAMVTSNLAKAGWPLVDLAIRFLILFLRLWPFIALAVVGNWITDRWAMDAKGRHFVGLWLIAAVLGVLSVPNFYAHYTLPLLVPLAVASSPLLRRQDVGLFLMSLLALFTMVLYNPWDRTERRLSIEAMEQMTAAIRRHDNGGSLLVYDGPSYLYALAEKRPTSPLAFPPHLNHWIERNVSQFETRTEVMKALRRRPSVVVAAVFPTARPTNGETRMLVMRYVQNNCQIVDVSTSYGYGGRTLIAVWGDCHEGAPDLVP